MSVLHNVVTMTTEGQITVPRAIRQALLAPTHAETRVAFELHEDERVVVSRADAGHEEPAIRAFLSLIERETEAGRGVEVIRGDVARMMPDHAGQDIDLDEPIEGNVGL